jgi:REP element-mobilizing transposase RayT
MSEPATLLLAGSCYHVVNRAVGDDMIFGESKNYIFFLQKTIKYVLPLVDIYAYCLMPNHFHLVIYIRKLTSDDLLPGHKNQNKVGQAFSNCFNSYAKAYNKLYDRRGKLFMQSYKKILITDEVHLRTSIKYVHRNPIHHGFEKDYSSWNYSSYRDYLSGESSIVEVEKGLKLFGSKEVFLRDHEEFRGKTDPTGF